MDPELEQEVEQGGAEVLPGEHQLQMNVLEAEIMLGQAYHAKTSLGSRFRVIQEQMFLFVECIQEKFEGHGTRVAKNPKRFIISLVGVVLTSMLGFFFFRQEKNPLRLWIPVKSDFYTDTNWLMENYGEGLRPQSILITAPDVLQPDVMIKLLDIHQKLINSSASIVTWQDVCFKVPVITFNIDGPRFRRQVSENGGISEGFDSAFNESFFKVGSEKSAVAKPKIPSIHEMMTDETFDPSTLFGRALYCSIVRNMPKDCLQQNILDLWKYDANVIKNLTKSQIVQDLNGTSYSPTLGHPMPFKSFLGGVSYDENGEIVSAQAVLSMYMVHINFSIVDMDEVGNDGGTADWANGPGLEWESHFLKVMHDASESAAGMQVYYEAGRSFGDISASGMFQDVDKLMIGIIMMFAYIQLQQCRTSCVESRMIPTMVGLLCVGVAFLTSVAVCSILGIPYGPVHTSLPFLLLGIGVDDMFVILSCWDSLPQEQKKLPIPKRMGIAMHHAGLSITITSVTDFVAFLIGSTTILPSLRSFCLYAAVGVFVTFILQSTIFVASLALDQRRMDAGRNFVFPWIQHTQPKLSDTKYVSQCSHFLKYIYSKLILTKCGKIVIIVTTVALMVAGIVGNCYVKQEFHPEWFLDQDSYLYKFLGKRDEFFPDFGNSAGVYLGRLHYNEELQNIGRLIHQLKKEDNILRNVEDWFGGFQRYVNFHHKKDIESQILSEDDFNQYISQYLFSPPGARFQKNFRFSKPLECGEPASSITVASIDFHFKKFQDSYKSVEAMNAVKNLVRSANFTTGDQFATVWAKVFANWVTDEVIGAELLRNIGLAFFIVGLTTCILVGSLKGSFWALLCVCLTLVNTTGFMHYWGLTIDLVSAIALVLAVGLCVDFAAHIVFAFICFEGTHNERALNAVTYIGGAVLHGGATTLLALSVLVVSRSYIFTAFFKVFFLVIFMGLFHGMVFLPVVLSLLGPLPYSSIQRQKRNNDDNNINNDNAAAPALEAVDVPNPYDIARGL